MPKHEDEMSLWEQRKREKMKDPVFVFWYHFARLELFLEKILRKVKGE